ncbi:General substrate transporter [Macrophomina phaseolina MS6]|uniref:General substrate transporter n=1 Tax=Macrophomina phaseolina (strain MS6) TaxID=1126212 RepID=K2RKP4_MACPH|nr:General substrate transporter [Macrophomina phaseolina MS6]
MFLVSRFMIGLGITIVSGSAPLMVAELAHPDSGATFTSLDNTLWYAGSIIAGWTNHGTYHLESSWPWRLPALLQALPAAIYMSTVWLLPESPRWPMGNDRHEETRKILMKYHANGDRESATVAAEFAEIRETMRLQLEGWQQSWRELVATKANRNRTLLVLCCVFFPPWSGTGLVSYFLVPLMRTIGIGSQGRITLSNGMI